MKLDAFVRSVGFLTVSSVFKWFPLMSGTFVEFGPAVRYVRQFWLMLWMILSDFKSVIPESYTTCFGKGFVTCWPFFWYFQPR